MSFLTGSNDTVSNVNNTTSKAQQELLKLLMSSGLLEGLFPSSNSIDLQPYQDLFTTQNKRGLAEAKESAGNLTGSGFANALGKRAGESATAQSAFLADISERRRNEDANRFASTLIGAIGSPAGGVTQRHTPGFLEYAFEGAAAAAPLIAAI